MSTIPPPSTADLLAQGVQALNTGDQAAARELLTQAVQRDLRHVAAWLWLSGAVATPGERRYCLEQVLALDPQHGAPRHGLALLPADVASVSPLPDPPQPARPTPPTPDPSEQAAAVASALTFGLPSRWDTPAAPAPAAPAPAAPAPSPAGPPRQAAAQTYQQHDIDLVVNLFGKHYSRDQIARMLSEQYSLGWTEAKGLIEHVEMYHSQRIAARQSPLLLGTGLVLLLGGVAMVIYGMPAVLRMLDADAAGMVYATYRTRQLQFFVVGVLMVLGSLVGLGQTIRSLWK